jgi:RNA polymerase sigma factor (sigma-70 family)
VPAGPTHPVDAPEFAGVLAGAQRGEAAAWERLYRWLAPAVAGYLRVQGARDVDDLTSGVFLGLVRGIGTFRGDATAFRSWVFVIVHRRLQDERRRRGRRPDPVPLDDATPVVSGDDVERDALARLARERVEARCATLAPDQRDVLLLRIVGDLTVDQVAAVLDKSPGAVKQLQRRGLDALRRAATPEGIPL